MALILDADRVLIGRKFEEDYVVVVDEEEGKIIDIIERFESELTHIPVKSFPSGSILIPGLNDTHTHLAQYGTNLSKPGVYHFESRAELLDFIRDYIRNHQRKVYIFLGYDENRWRDEKTLTKKELDAISRDVPIIVRRVCGHKAVLNSKAIEMVGEVEGLDAETGIAVEELPLKLSVYFPPSRQEIEEGILRAQEEALSQGITSITDITRPMHFRVYQKLHREGKLKLKVNVILYEEDMEAVSLAGFEYFFGDEHLRFSGIKIFLDGSVGAGTAAFFPDRGILTKTDEELKGLLKMATDRNLQIAAHAIGERAINQFLNVFESLFSENPLRHRIEHYEFPLPEDLDRTARLGIPVSVQPNFVHLLCHEGQMYTRKLPSEVVKRCNPYRTMEEKGIHYAFGSDNMPMDVRMMIKGAVEHPVESERLSLQEALYRFSTAGALFSFEEGIKGEIKQGQRADIVVMDEETLEPLMVMVDGEIIGE